MAIGNLYSSGFTSSIKYDALTPWVTTTALNQVINFTDNGQQRQLNSLMIEAEATPLYIRILPSDYCVYVPANTSIAYDFTKIESIQVMNAIGTKLRWSGNFY
jgi:hypothetical protein